MVRGVGRIASPVRMPGRITACVNRGCVRYSYDPQATINRSGHRVASVPLVSRSSSGTWREAFAM